MARRRRFTKRHRKNISRAKRGLRTRPKRHTLEGHVTKGVRRGAKIGGGYGTLAGALIGGAAAGPGGALIGAGAGGLGGSIEGGVTGGAVGTGIYTYRTSKLGRRRAARKRRRR